MLRPLPRPIAPLRQQRTDGGAAPDPGTGALLAERRTVVVAACLTRAQQAALGPTEALRLPNAVELAIKVVSGLGQPWLDAFVRIEDHAAAETSPAAAATRRTGEFVAFPQGSMRAVGAGWERPQT